MRSGSKYRPLQNFLASAHGAELPMSFADIEQVLGFKLPASARRHSAWWSNDHGTNPAVNAWRDVGWQTSRVDRGNERLIFVRRKRAIDDAQEHAEPGVSEEAGFFVRFDGLTALARRLLEDYCEEAGTGPDKAAVDILNNAALERRRALVEKFARLSPRVSGDSTDLIREDRDGR